MGMFGSRCLFGSRKYCNVQFLIILIVFQLFIFYGIAFSSSGESSGAGHDSAATKGWVVTDTYRVMNFAVLAAALFFVLRKPAGQFLNDRVDEIREQLKDLELKKVKAEKELGDSKSRYLNLNKEAERLINEYISQGDKAKKRILEEAKLAADKLQEQSIRNIDNEFKLAKLKIQQQLFTKAIDKAEEAIKSKIDKKDQENLIDEYIEKVVA